MPCDSHGLISFSAVYDSDCFRRFRFLACRSVRPILLVGEEFQSSSLSCTLALGACCSCSWWSFPRSLLCLLVATILPWRRLLVCISCRAFVLCIAIASNASAFPLTILLLVVVPLTPAVNVLAGLPLIRFMSQAISCLFSSSYPYCLPTKYTSDLVGLPVKSFLTVDSVYRRIHSCFSCSLIL